MKNVVLVTLALAIVLLIGCRSAKQTTSNTESNSANASSPQMMNTEQPAREPQWAQVAPNISLMGMARKGIDGGNSTPEKPKYTYQVEVHIKNTGAKPIIFDTVQLAFEPGKGEPLLQLVNICQRPGVRFTETRFNPTSPQPCRESQAAYAGMPGMPGKLLTVVVKNREERDWDIDSDGFTSDLVKRAGGEPVVFSFELLAKGKNIAGPFRAALPELNSLTVPSAGQGAQDNKRQASGVNLKFQ